MTEEQEKMTLDDWLDQAWDGECRKGGRLTTVLAAADWCIDQGRPDIAYALRWMASRRPLRNLLLPRWPALFVYKDNVTGKEAGYRAKWRRLREGSRRESFDHLPGPIYTRMGGDGGTGAAMLEPTRGAALAKAVEALAAALAELRRLVLIDPEAEMRT